MGHNSHLYVKYFERNNIFKKFVKIFQIQIRGAKVRIFQVESQFSSILSTSYPVLNVFFCRRGEWVFEALDRPGGPLRKKGPWGQVRATQIHPCQVGLVKKTRERRYRFFHKAQNYLIKVLKFKVLLLIPVVPVRTEPALDWELTRIPEEVLDRLSSIFTIWYIPVNHFILWYTIGAHQDTRGGHGQAFFHLHHTVYSSKPFYPVVYHRCSPGYQRRSWTGFLPCSPYGIFQ